ncbi:MAG: hypothetical protein SFY67_12445 [Candidatus Melainabacteria bacterium]|nr:hypothetical protein [Candidatus Melainabacteria bacterium]
MTTKASKPIDNLILSYHCPVDWNSMDGNERERFCKQCSKSVFNISDLSREQANEYLQQRSNESHCVKFYLRSDGTITTDDCPRILRPARNTARFIGRVVAGFVSVLIYSIANSIPLFASENKDSKQTSAASIFKKDVEFRYRASIMLGQTCPSEIGDLCKLLFNMVPENDIEKSLLSKIPTDAYRGQDLEIELIQQLSNYYKTSQQTDRYLLAKMIETSIQIETANYKTTEKELKLLEDLQLKATDFIVTEAEQEISQGNKKEAENLAIYSLRLGECGKRIPYHDLYLPQKNTRWRVSPRYVKDMSIVMRQSTLKRLLAVLDKIGSDSIFANPDIEKIENPNTAQDTATKLPSEFPKPEFYKKELLQTPIVVIANFELKRINDKSKDGLPLRLDCFEVNKILKAPEQIRKILEQSKLLRGQYTLQRQNKPEPITAIHRRFDKECVLFIKSVELKDSDPPYLHCDFGSTVEKSDELETKFQKWILQQTKSSKSK